MRLAIVFFALGLWTSYATGTEIDGKLSFPDEATTSSDPVQAAVVQKATPVLVAAFRLRTLPADPDTIRTSVDPDINRSPVPRSLSRAQTDVVCDGPCLNLNTVNKSELNLPTLMPALCDVQGQCYLAMEPSYNVSDKDLDKPLTPIPLVPVYKGTEKDKGEKPTQDSDKDLRPTNNTALHFVRKLVPHYDFPVVPVYKSKTKVVSSYPQYPTYPNERKAYGVVYPVRKVYRPNVFPSSVSHRPPSNSGQKRPGNNQQRYPYPYGHYGLQTQHSLGWFHPTLVRSVRPTSQGQRWTYMIPQGQRSGTSNYQGTLREVQGVSNRIPCSYRCSGVMEHRNGNTIPRKPSFNVSGKLEFPQDNEAGTSAFRKEMKIDGKMGTIQED